MKNINLLFEKYNVNEQLDAFMPRFTDNDTINEEKLPTKYPVKDAPKVKGWFGLISVKYMAKVRNIRKLCISYINTYVEKALDVVENLDKVKMFSEMKNLATDLAMSYDDKKSNERSVNTKTGLAFLGGDKAMAEKLDAILAQIDKYAEKNEQLKLWADLMKLKSKEIACNIIYHETREIIEKNASEADKKKLKETDKQFIEAGEGANKALEKGAKKTEDAHKRIDMYRKAITEYYEEKEGDELPDEISDGGKFSQKKLESLSNVALAEIIGSISDEKERTELMKKHKITDKDLEADEFKKDNGDDEKDTNESLSYVMTSYDAFCKRYLNE